MARKEKAPETKPCPGACGGSGKVDIIVYEADGKTVDKASSKYGITCISCGGKGEVPA